ncbi:zinc ribbon domain-containing protein [Caldicellulosiruptor changbaiensis]|uniref:Zinc ribbon domain-containing protein n=1 Tax=Caldicellulosiruptor changbaiensis TaxID=1222016 RepID=A0A3T0D4D0_9FIRM|nr:FmdB family zinc ribbon protein [Caldicellulosiruptor changbaiensis]AZT89896.1 zinc ribbon domain-containing protein [Caldicellulosiruptor changbaiensis]
MLYTYICNSCEEVFEVKASISEISNGLKVSCPKCASEDVRRDYSRINFGTSVGNGSKGESCSTCSGNRGCCGS